MDGQVLALTGSTVLMIDVGTYGIKEWLAVIGSVFGIGGSIFGIWRAWRYSKSQVAARLLEYLRDEEAKIKEARNRIIRRLRQGVPMVGEIEHDFYRSVRKAINESANGDLRQATRTLDQFAETLDSDIKLGQKYLSNANLQLATVLLVRGRSANEHSEPTTARSAWEAALQCYSHDAEAARYLGELALAEGDLEAAVDHFGNAIALAPDDNRLKAETLEQLAAFHRRRGKVTSELEALGKCAPSFVLAGDYVRAAAAYARAGEIAVQLNRSKQGPQFLRDAFDNYKQAADENGMRQIRSKLEDLGEDVSGMQLEENALTRQISWPLIRLALELSILVVAGGLFYFSLR